MFRWLQRRKHVPEDVATFGVSSVEEEHWRRRMILAARKLQQAQRTLSSDLEHIQTLHELLESSGMRIEELAAGLSTTQGVVSGLEKRLEEHKELLRTGRSPVPSDPGGDEGTTDLFAQSELAVTQLVERIHELRDRLTATPPSAHAQELTRQVSEQQQHIRRLEAENRELATLLGDGALPAGEPIERLHALEDCVRELEMEKAELEMRHVQQMIELADQTRSRIRELELEVVRRGEKLRHLETLLVLMGEAPAPLPQQGPFDEDPGEDGRGAELRETAFVARPALTPEGLVDSELFLDELENHR